MGEYHSVLNLLPKPSEGDGNFVRVHVYTERGLKGSTIYGTSGAPGEGYGFSKTIQTDCGNVGTNDKIQWWKYAKSDPTQTEGEG